MSSIIKNFDQFQSLNEADSFWSGLVGNVIGGAKNVVVGQLVDTLTSKLGIKADSFGGTVIRNMVQSLDLSEYPKFITGDVQVKDLAPKMADATIATLTDLGVDGIATRVLKLEGEQKDGLVYKMIKELISNQASREDFRENLVKIWTWILGGGSSSAAGGNQNSPFGAIMAQSRGSADQQSRSSDTPDSRPSSGSNLSWDSISSMIIPGGRGTTSGQ